MVEGAKASSPKLSASPMSDARPANVCSVAFRTK